MLDKLKLVEARYEELNELMSSPEVIGDRNKLRDLGKEHSNLIPIVQASAKYQGLITEYEGALEMVNDSSEPELKEMAKEEAEELKEQIDELEGKLKLMLVPKDPMDDKNAIMEIRAGTGGDEAALFASDLFKMYTRYIEKEKWTFEELSVSPSEVGGFKEIIFLVKGNNAYGTLKYEGGVHRVQRVPATETSGRIHTSAATVAILPEAEDVEIDIDPSDLQIDVYRSSGPGGQSVNTTDSAVRVTHHPTGIVVTCQDEKSQHKNKAKALKVLKSRLLSKAQEEEMAKTAGTRKLQVSTGDRSAKIRTYNFQEKRVTDHRINFTLYKLDDVLLGNLDEFIENLKLADQAERLASDN